MLPAAGRPLAARFDPPHHRDHRAHAEHTPHPCVLCVWFPAWGAPDCSDGSGGGIGPEGRARCRRRLGRGCSRSCEQPAAACAASSPPPRTRARALCTCAAVTVARRCRPSSSRERAGEPQGVWGGGVFDCVGRSTRLGRCCCWVLSLVDAGGGGWAGDDEEGRAHCCAETEVESVGKRCCYGGCRRPRRRLARDGGAPAGGRAVPLTWAASTCSWAPGRLQRVEREREQ
jgi:hypothetical protein